MSDLGALIVITLCVSVLVLPKKYAAIPFYISIIYLSRAEKIDIAGFSFFAYRIVLFFGAIRIIIRGEIKNYPFRKFEIILFANFIWLAIAAGLRDRSMVSLLNCFSAGFDSGLAYLYARATFIDLSNIYTTAKVYALIMLPFMLLLFTEKHTVHNYFSVLNGVKEMPIIRNGKVRASGPFAHAILAGTAAAVHLPLMIILRNNSKLLGNIGCISVLGVVYACSSSGPIMTLTFAIFATLLWYKKDKIAQYRSYFIIFLIILEIYRQFNGGHVWDYLARIDLTGSSTGWHRAALITSWLQHFNEWWQIGTNYTRHWMPTGVTFSPNHTDITNEYIAQAINGGLISVTVHIYVIYQSFCNISECANELKSNKERLILWALGSSLFAHTATFVSIAYFDQTILFYFFLIGTITAASVWVKNEE